MNKIDKFKEAIDHAISCADPNEFGITSTLSTRLFICQQQFSNVPSKRNSSIDPGSKKKLTELKRKIKEKIATLEVKKGKAKKQELEDLESRLTELNEALGEIEVVLKSSTKYAFHVDTEPKLEYEDVSDTAIISYDGTLGSLMNELKHAFQFETGKLDFIKVNTKEGSINVPGLTYDLGDELETYKRQYAYDGILKLRVKMSEEELMQQLKSGKIKSGLGLGTLEIKKMKKITANIIVKVQDKLNSEPLYKNISKKSLDINSSIGAIKKGNKNNSTLFNFLGLNEENKDTPYIDFIKEVV